MTNILTHRGPDSQDIYVSPDGVCALGYTRLAIVDPTNTTKQPLETQDGKAVLSFNGEIYNYLEVRDHLTQKGVHFRTRMDTEVLLEGLYRQGEQFLDELDGMWAFAYYDVSRRRLLLSRDLMGERHLFYRIDHKKGEVIFASEIAPLIADADERFEIDFDALSCSLRFYTAPPGKTLLKGIERLLPGHVMVVREKETPEMHRYKKLHPEKWFEFFGKNPSFEEVVDLYKALFLKVSKRRIPLDVPFIATLSGGIDSALVCLFASEFGEKSIQTLFGQSDERAPARAGELSEDEASQFTARTLGTEHHMFKMDNDECIPVLEYIGRNGFDGILDPGVASFEMLARKVRQMDRKVILISDGPDELLGGYPSDQKAWAFDRMAVAHPARYRFLKFLSSVRGGARMMQIMGRGDLLIPRGLSRQPFQFSPIHCAIGPDLLSSLIPAQYVERNDAHYGTLDPAYQDLFGALDYTQLRALSYATKTLPDMFNLRTDKGFLHASVECRLPHQAPEMVEFMIAMPAHLRFGKQGDTTKYLLRKIVERYIGKEIAYRSKYGFGARLWRSEKAQRVLNVKELLRTTSLFEELPFKSGARALVLAPENRKLLWPFYVLASTSAQLKRPIG
ncbi:MAG: asparagine synthase [Parcubacteria group bacterium GW2011_GWC2_45_7]|nr:MAG: asparagine synthase [Parcubacteria group bacterium GW2011_GWC2_45_7]